jgi:hypothetical protein
MKAASWTARHRRKLRSGGSTDNLRIVTNERRDFTVGGTEGDSRVDTSGERRDTVFEEMSDDLHDCRLVLDDSNIGGLMEFTGVSAAERTLTMRHRGNSLPGHECQSR